MVTIATRTQTRTERGLRLARQQRVPLLCYEIQRMKPTPVIHRRVFDYGTLNGYVVFHGIVPVELSGNAI